MFISQRTVSWYTAATLNWEVGIGRAKCAGGSVMMGELRQVGWGLVIEDFVCYEVDFEVDSLGDLNV